MSESSTTAEVWTPWRVAPRSGFEVNDRKGSLGLEQIDRKQFLVSQSFRFTDEGAILDDLRRKLAARSWDTAKIERAINDARTFTPAEENPTDMASIPRYMRWFENTYGLHTPAAILHDQLIRDKPNAGALESDTLADRFFREMMGAAGVKCLKRWIMWAAVALRSRWAAGGRRRAFVCIWIVAAVVGLSSFVTALGSAAFGWGHPIGTGWLWLIGLALPFASAPLWGRQYGGSLIAAIAALWILPASILAFVGYALYGVLEAATRRLGLK
jgi:hypothetical protein